jgi:hypothetical protein
MMTVEEYQNTVAAISAMGPVHCVYRSYGYSYDWDYI